VTEKAVALLGSEELYLLQLRLFRLVFPRVPMTGCQRRSVSSDFGKMPLRESAFLQSEPIIMSLAVKKVILRLAGIARDFRLID
jgi:hypothetical protein